MSSTRRGRGPEGIPEEIKDLDFEIGPESEAEGHLAPEGYIGSNFLSGEIGEHPEHNDPETARYITKGRLALALATGAVVITGVIAARKLSQRD